MYGDGSKKDGKVGAGTCTIIEDGGQARVVWGRSLGLGKKDGDDGRGNGDCKKGHRTGDEGVCQRRKPMYNNSADTQSGGEEEMFVRENNGGEMMARKVRWWDAVRERHGGEA